MQSDLEWGELGTWGANTTCEGQVVTYAKRYNDLEHYNWCIVPNSGADAVLYGAIAILLGCLVSGKLSSVWILVAGAVVEAFAFNFNLRQLSNATALWMGMNPPDIFLYIFLPPLLLDSAIRIEFFTFRKVAAQVMTFAVLAVIGMALIMTPLMLYAFDLSAAGWHWSHAALFVCMIASTDAVAVTAVLKKANGPETLGVLMEGESLFNDATSIVMFELVLEKVKEYETGTLDNGHVLMQLWYMTKQMTTLAVGGAACGMIAGVITTKLMKLLRVRGMPPDFEVCITVGMCYLTYYVTNAPLHLSGVIAVVVYGLYGSATLKWDMSAVASQEHFPRFWDVLSQLTNTVVFFFSGAACVNFFIRSTRALEHNGYGGALAVAFWRLPLIFISIMVVRMLLIAMFSPMLKIFGAQMDWRGVLLCTVGGLRGALCLIMVQTVVLDIGVDGQNMSERMSAVKSSLAMWTAGVVLCTLFINAPALGFILRVTGLTKVSLLTLQSRDKARQQFLKFTDDCINELQADEDELLQGVDWIQVHYLIDCTAELKELVAPGGEEDLFTSDAAAGMVPDEQFLYDDDEVEHGDDVDGHSDQEPSPRVGKSLLSLSRRPASGVTTSFYTHSSQPFPMLSRLGRPGKLQEEHTPASATPFDGPSTVASPVAPREGSGAEANGASLEGATTRSQETFSYADAVQAMRGSNEEERHLATVKAPGLSLGMIAALEEKQRRKLVSKLDNKITQSVGIESIGEGFSLQKKDSYANLALASGSLPAASRGGSLIAPQATAGTPLDDNDVTKPLLDSVLSSPHLVEALEAGLPAVRSEPFILLLDPSTGFVAPSLPAVPSASLMGSDSEGDSHGHCGHHSHKPPLRSLSVPGQTSPSKRARSEGNFMSITDMQLHHIQALPAGALQRLHEEMVAEHRLRLIAGLKRYFHRKRHEGLLSSQGLRLLDNACDSCTDEHLSELDVFGYMHKDFSAGPMVWLFSACNFRIRQIHMCLRCIRSRRVRNFISFPFTILSRVFSSILSDRLLLALEVAIEYWLALTYSMEAKNLAEDASEGSQEAVVQQALREEMEKQKSCVWQFITDRHLEAPDRFRAIQTYRAAMAIMAQQRQFIHRMYNSGMLSDAEKSLMEEAVEGKERALRERGASWDPPTVSSMLRQLPFLADISDVVFEEILLQGHMVRYQKGAVITDACPSADPGDPFIGVVLSGLAATTITSYATMVRTASGRHTTPDPADEPSTAFLTRGSVFGVLGTISGAHMPGRGTILAHSETSATHVFQIPKKVFDEVAERSNAGDASCRTVMRSLHRLAAVQILERFQDLYIETVSEGLRALGYAPTGALGASREQVIAQGSAEKWRNRTSKRALEAHVSARCMWAALRSLLQRGPVLVVAPEEVFQLSSSAVLVRGCMDVAKQPSGGGKPQHGKGAALSKATAAAPCVLVWPEYKPGTGDTSTKVALKAGAEGAVLVLVDPVHEYRTRLQVNASENVLKEMRKAARGERLSAAQRANFRLHESYFGASVSGTARQRAGHAGSGAEGLAARTGSQHFSVL